MRSFFPREKKASNCVFTTTKNKKTIPSVIHFRKQTKIQWRVDTRLGAAERGRRGVFSRSKLGGPRGWMHVFIIESSYVIGVENCVCAQPGHAP